MRKQLIMTEFLNSVQILCKSDSSQIGGIFAEESFVIENTTIVCGIALAKNLNGIQKFSQCNQLNRPQNVKLNERTWQPPEPTTIAFT